MPALVESSPAVVFPYATLRNISTPQDDRLNRKVYVGYAPFASILGLSTHENVRDYLLEAEGKKRRQPTQVHRAIQETLETNPEEFSILNGGVVIVAREASNDQTESRLTLVKPSIINGSQTQGVLKEFFDRVRGQEGERPLDDVHVKFEVIITDSEELIANTSIARNFQNDVMAVSIVGRLGLLDELEQRIQGTSPEQKLRKSETHWVQKLTSEENFVYTEKLIQVLTAFIPAELWLKGDTESPNKVYTYGQKTKCLRDFQQVAEAARESDRNDPEREGARKLYEFFLDIAPQALELYHKWKQHQGFVGHRIRNWTRSDDGSIEEVPDGVVFPILAALSAFATQTRTGWRIRPPEAFDEEELIRAAVSAYRETAGSNPNTMGKSKACYTQLYQITSIYKKLAPRKV